jgi:prepilin-type N-terminal cleavage/methylation domain-containing protein
MSKNKAFTLVELSIVIVIISVLLITSVPVMTGALNNAKIKVTNDRMKAIYQAMGAYLATHKRLPCPASPLIAKSNSASYGLEIDCSYNETTNPSSSIGIWRSIWNKNLWYGMLPVKALKLPAEMAEDGFGTKFDYYIINGFANSALFGDNQDPNYIGNGAARSTSNILNRIKLHEKLGSTYLMVTGEAIFVIISHGANKSGGWIANGTTRNTVSTDASEVFNSLRGSVDSPSVGRATVYSYDTTVSDYSFMVTDRASDIFDDVVLYKTRNQIVQDFNLYNLIKCPANPSAAVYGATTITLTQANYGDVVEGSPACSSISSYNKTNAYHAAKCGKFGVWEGPIRQCGQ